MTIRTLTYGFCALMLLLSGLPRDSYAQEWVERAPMPHAVHGITAGAVNGSIYVAGGQDRRGNVLDALIRFDVESGEWHVDLPAMDERRYFAASAVLDGKFYVIGGRDEDDEVLESVEVFDPVTGEWSEVHELEEARYAHAAVVLDGRLYVLGGAGEDNEILDSVEVYDLEEDEWKISDRWRLDQPRTAFATAAVGGAAFSFGGIGRVPLPQVQRFDFLSGSDIFFPPGLLGERASLAAVAVDDSSIYIIGGRNSRNRVLDEVVSFTPSKRSGQQWMRAPRLVQPRESFAGVEIDGTIFVMGGRDQDERPLDSMESLMAGTSVAAEDPAEAAGFVLEQNHPNPFTTSTAITFTVGGDASARVVLEVYDVRGRLVTRLVDAHLPPGSHEAEWDGSAGGRPAPSGVYLYVLRTGESEQTKMMTRIR